LRRVAAKLLGARRQHGRTAGGTGHPNRHDRTHDALLVVADSALLDLDERIAGLALRHRLPTFSSIPEFTDAGALLGYGPSRRDSYRRAATYVKKVLEGAKPADLPVEQPTLFELAINMQTARALGIVIPATLLARAERVIE
jgi:putative tryptophan/tyrosine transport system substrate-binding protein